MSGGVRNAMKRGRSRCVALEDIFRDQSRSSGLFAGMSDGISATLRAKC